VSERERHQVSCGLTEACTGSAMLTSGQL